MIRNLNQNDFEICQTHREKIIYIDKQQSKSAKRALCTQCVVEQEKNSNLKMIDNVKIKLSIMIKQLIQNRESRTQLNLDLLKDLHNFLHQQQVKFCQQIEKCQSNIDNQIILLEKANLSYISKISQITIHDLNAPDKIKSQMKQEIIDCKGVKESLMKQINNLEVLQIKQLYDERIQKIDFGDQNLELEQLCDMEFVNNKNEQLQNSIWKCDQHQEDIMFIDLGYQQTIPNRLACRKCVPRYNIQFTNVEDLQILWEKYDQDTQKQAQSYRNFQQKINKKIQQQIREFKIEINQELDRLTELIQESLKFNINDSLYKPFTLLQKNWMTISKDEIIIIADSISHENREQYIKKNVKKEFKHKEQLLNNTINNNLQQMKDKFNSLISEISERMSKENTPDNQNGRNFKIRPKNYSILGPPTTRVEKTRNDNSPQSRREDNIDSNRDSFQIDSPQIQKGNRMQSKFKSNWGIIQQLPFRYEQISEIDENSATLVIAINSQSSILVLGQYMGVLKVFSFDNGQIKLIQILEEHTYNVRCLYFMKKSSSFISGSNDKSIIIWHEDIHNKWYSSQKLIGHEGQILCLIMNNQENLIISGSKDKTIRFWIYDIDWKCHQTLKAHQNSVRSISLNSEKNQLISCAEEEQRILVIQLQQFDNTWSVVNEIKVSYWGQSLLFINESMFLFQPHGIDQLHLFKQQQSFKQNQYICKQQIKIKSEEDCNALFPIMFIKSKSILMTKNSRFINIIRKDRNDKYILEQSFENVNNCCGIYGCLTSDGEFLITWEGVADEDGDGDVNKIIVRKFKNY